MRYRPIYQPLTAPLRASFQLSEWLEPRTNHVEVSRAIELGDQPQHVQ